MIATIKVYKHLTVWGHLMVKFKDLCITENY